MYNVKRIHISHIHEKGSHFYIKGLLLKIYKGLESRPNVQTRIFKKSIREHSSLVGSETLWNVVLCSGIVWNVREHPRSFWNLQTSNESCLLF